MRFSCSAFILLAFVLVLSAGCQQDDSFNGPAGGVAVSSKGGDTWVVKELDSQGLLVVVGPKESQQEMRVGLRGLRILSLHDAQEHVAGDWHGKVITLETEPASQGRGEVWSAYVFANGQLLNEELIVGGYAEFNDSSGPYKYADRLGTR